MGAGTPGVWGTRGAIAPARPVSRAVLLAAALVGLLVLAAVTVATLADPGRYGSSGAGCVNLTVPSTTGGAVVHACGDRAATLCRSAFAGSDRIDLLIRPECVAAGLGP